MQGVVVSGNRILNLLSDQEAQRLGGELRPISLHAGQSLQEQGEEIQRVYFLHGGLCSIRRETAKGQTVEVASVGSEGIVGISAAFGEAADDNTHATMIVAGEASWMSIAAFRSEMNRRGTLARIVQRYAQQFMSSLEVEAACHALHPIDQRLARWLLEAADRLQTREIPLTQETLASVLGVRRASVTVAAASLERMGLIRHASRRIQLHDRRGLEALSCECYETWQALARQRSGDAGHSPNSP